MANNQSVSLFETYTDEQSGGPEDGTATRQRLISPAGTLGNDNEGPMVRATATSSQGLSSMM